MFTVYGTTPSGLSVIHTEHVETERDAILGFQWWCLVFRANLEIVEITEIAWEDGLAPSVVPGDSWSGRLLEQRKRRRITKR